MKLFVDTADLADIETIAEWGVLSGVTTNPTLLSKVDGEPEEIYRRVCELVDGPVSAEVVADSRGDMVEEGLLSATAPDHSRTGDRPDRLLLERVLDGLQSL